MFFGSATDLYLMIKAFQLLAIFCVVFWVFKRKTFLTLLIFSIGADLIFILNFGSRVFYIYHILWLKYLSLTLWPLLNIYLIYRYRKFARSRRNGSSNKAANIA